MNEPAEKPRAICSLCLLSGGLDSQLAVCVLRDQGVDVCGVSFESPFFSADKARNAAKAIGIPLYVVDFTAEILAILTHPKHGFGRCMNPCIDCHAAMVRRSGRIMEEKGYHFLSTGEVLNERPMSQNRKSLMIVSKESGYEDVLLRPLSAQLLPETKPERLGWVDRTKLLALSGRARKVQMEMARHFGLADFPTPAGGCRLTEPNFSRRLKDLRDHGGLDDVHAIHLLTRGRHFRLGADVKVVIGRNEAENMALEGMKGEDEWILSTEECPGPVGILPVGAGDDVLERAAAICARYSDSPEGQSTTVLACRGKDVRRMTVTPMPAVDVESLLI